MDASSSLGIQGTGGRVKKPLTRKEKIQEELRLLEWHKMANDAAIKASLMQNRQLKAELPTQVPTHTTEDAKWMRKVIQQEHIKPLEVNKEYVLEYERREKENEERLTTQVERHIGTLQKLRNKLESKAAMKQRTDEYRAWQKEFTFKKQEVMLGKTLAEIEPEGPADKENDVPVIAAKRKGKPSSQLSNVLESLNKLSELENRITSLENDNVYERMKQQERPAADRRTVMDFKKTRAVRGPENEPGKGPMSVVYSMKPKQKSWKVEVPGITKKAPLRRGVPAMTGRGTGYDGDADGGDTFALTGIDAGGRSTNPKLDRARALHDASNGQKSLRGRIQAKKSRIRDVREGNKRHNEALGELNRRRNEQQIQKRPPRSMMATKGASAGVRSNNRHLNDFQKTKNQLQKRTVAVKRNAATDPRGMRVGRKTSRTAPSMTVAGGGLNATRRMPNTRGGAGGNVTRRTDAPQRRGMGQASGAASAPAVGGLGGIRALRNKRDKN
eukprot:GSChrysophyteH1.ASY1.ANO1.1633.1 assembled CDS